MKRRFLPLVLALVCALCLCVGLAACEQPTFAVTVESGEGFTVTGIRAEGYAKDATVSFTVNVTDSSKQISAVKANGEVLTATADGHYEFVMPEKDVVISVALADKTPNPPSKYTVTVESGEGFTVEGIDSEGYAKDAVVSFTVTVADAKKQVGTVKADDTTLIAKADGHYEFAMPEKAVVIHVTIIDKLPVLSLSAEKVELNALVNDKKSVQITASVDPADDTHEIEWKSDNENVATVVGNGKTATITGVAKGQAIVKVSFKGLVGAQALEIEVNVDSYLPWNAAQEALMKEHLHGLVLEPVAVADMDVAWHDRDGELIIEGGFVEGAQLVEYAARYTEEKGWKDVSDLYNAPLAFIFEKAVSTTDGTRYVRVFIYALDDFNEFDVEGALIIEAYDPYVYEWPEEYAEAFAGYYDSDIEIPAISASHYTVETLLIVAHNASTTVNDYSALLQSAGYAVEHEAAYSRAVSPDGLFGLMFFAEDSDIVLAITLPTNSDWPEKAIKAYFIHWASKGAEEFDVPAFEGEGVSFVFEDDYYNSSSYIDPTNLHGTVTVKNSSQALTEAYVAKLVAAGWTALNEESTSYVLPVNDKVALIEVRFDAYEDETTIIIYYVLRDAPAGHWDAQAIAEKLTSNYTDTIPAYEGKIVKFEIIGNDIYVQVPPADSNTARQDYQQTLLDANFTQNAAGAYVSPNKQFALMVFSGALREDTFQITISELATSWNAEAIAALLQKYGSTATLPELTTAVEYEMTFPEFETSNEFMIRLTPTNGSFSQADADAYIAKLLEAGWTESGGKYYAEDGTYVNKVSYLSYNGMLQIDIYCPGVR